MKDRIINIMLQDLSLTIFVLIHQIKRKTSINTEILEILLKYFFACLY